MDKKKIVVIIGTILSLCLFSFIWSVNIMANPDLNTGEILEKRIVFENSYKISNITSYYENFYITNNMYDLEVDMDLEIIMSDTAIPDISSVTIYANEVPVSSFKFSELNENPNIQLTIGEHYFEKGNNSISIKAFVKSTEDDCELNEEINWALLRRDSNISIRYKLKQLEYISEFYEGTYYLDNNEGKIILAVPDEMTEFDYTTLATVSALIGHHFKTYDYNIAIDTIRHSQLKDKQHSVIILGNYETLNNEFSQVDFSFMSDGQNQLSIGVRNVNNVSNIFVAIKDEKQLLDFTSLFSNESLYGQLKLTEYISDMEIEKRELNNAVPVEISGKISEIGYENSMTIGSGHQIFQYYLGIPGRDTMLKENTLKFKYTYSDFLDYADSYLTIYINDEPIKTQALTKEMSENDSIEFSIPSNLYDYNGFYITLDFNLSKNSPCESKISQGSWVKIDTESSEYNFKLQERKDFSLFTSTHFIQNSIGEIDREILIGTLDKDLDSFANFCSYLGKRSFGVNLLKTSQKEGVPENYRGLILGSSQDELIRSASEKMKFRFDADGKIISNDLFKQVNDKIGIIQISDDAEIVLIAGSDTNQLNNVLDYYTKNINRYDSQIITMDDVLLSSYIDKPEEIELGNIIEDIEMVSIVKRNRMPILILLGGTVLLLFFSYRIRKKKNEAIYRKNDDNIDE